MQISLNEELCNVKEIVKITVKTARSKTHFRTDRGGQETLRTENVAARRHDDLAAEKRREFVA